MFYIVNEKNEVLGWNNKEDHDAGNPPVLLQPSWPDYTPWTKEEAESWAKSWVDFESGVSDTVPLSGPKAMVKTRIPEDIFVLPNGDMVSEQDFNVLLAQDWQPGQEYPAEITIINN